MPDIRRVKERLFLALVSLLALAAVAPLFHILATLALRGLGAIVEAGPGFFTQAPAAPGSGELGGIGPALLGTVWLGLVSALLGVPLAVLTGVFIVEYRGSLLAGLVRLSTSSLVEVPTVLIGMLVFLLIVKPMGHYSILAGAVAVSLVMLPYTVSYVERALSQVPHTYREAGYAMGMTRSQVAYRVAVAIARRGVAAGVLVGVSKALSETAPLLFTLGSARGVYPTSPGSLLEPGDAVPLLIFQLAQTPYENWQELAWGAGLVLTLLVLLLFTLVKLLVREVRV